MRVLILLTTFVAAVLAERYDGHQVWEVQAASSAQVATLRTLAKHGHLTIAKEMTVEGTGYVIITPEKFRNTRLMLTMAGIKSRLHVANIQEGIQKEMDRLQKRYAVDPYAYDSEDFNTFEALMSQIDKWIANCPSGLTCTKYSIGKTHQGRDLTVIKFTKTGSDNRVLWFESCIHAREWLSCATTQNLVEHIVNNYGSDSEVKGMVDKYDFHFLLIANPDGYKYTWSNSRMWRKNRRRNPLGLCYGADLNRNFDTMWGKEGTDPSECSDIYPGESAASEPTTKHIQNALIDLKSKEEFAAMFAIHCFGNMWMFPHSHTVDHLGRQCVRTPDHADLVAVVAKGSAALEAKEGNYGWRTGTICETIYPVTGSTADYMYEKGVKYSFAMELRGDWFVVDKSEILPSFREFWAGIVASTAEMARIEDW